MLSQPLPRQNPEPILKLKEEMRHSLTGFGFQELITYSLTSLERLKKLLPEHHHLDLMPLHVAHPMTAEHEYLRTNLRSNLLATLEANRKHEDGIIRLFELGKVYLPQPGDLPNERDMVCALLSSARVEKLWQSENDLLNFYDAKGVVEGIMGHLNIDAKFEKSEDESLHPIRQAVIVIANNRLGVIGELHPKVLEAFNLSETVYLLELNLTDLLPFTMGHKIFRTIPRFPTVVRDIALVVQATVVHQKILEIITSFPLVAHASIFDVYSGSQVQLGKKSLAYRISFQSPTHTLTDEEVNIVQKQILDKLSQEFGATLRT
jgi:phenylalanyl-tRNA synthetase beta chain